MEPKIWKNRKIQTNNKDGKANGFLVPIFNIHDGNIDSAQSLQQVYLTICAPGEIKGPHLHMLWNI